MKRVVNEADLKWEVYAAGTNQELRGKALCDQGGRAKIGVGLLELPPGSNTKPAHYHSLEEEHLYALSGQAILHLGAEEFELGAGSYVCFPADQKVFHHIENRNDAPFRYLMIGERIAGDQVTHDRSS